MKYYLIILLPLMLFGCTSNEDCWEKTNLSIPNGYNKNSNGTENLIFIKANENIDATNYSLIANKNYEYFKDYWTSKTQQTSKYVKENSCFGFAKKEGGEEIKIIMNSPCPSKGALIKATYYAVGCGDVKLLLSVNSINSVVNESYTEKHMQLHITSQGINTPSVRD